MLTAIFLLLTIGCFVGWRVSGRHAEDEWFVAFICGIIVTAVVFLVLVLGNYCENVTLRHLMAELGKADTDAEVLRTKIAEQRADIEKIHWLGWFGK